MAGNNKNILLLVADDLGPLGCYGAKNLKTPNIDLLASNGTKFDMAFASTASCSGSRSTIYTGLHTHQNGQYGLANNQHHFITFEHIDTAPKIFNELGYQTGIIGKVHVGPESVYPWEIREENMSRNVVNSASRAAAFFEKAKESNRPFFLTVGFVDPHRDRTRSGFGNDTETGVRGHKYDPKDVEVPPYLQDLPDIRTELAEYYESITRLDDGVGMVLEALEMHGLHRDTMIVFVSDNGPPFINSKTTLYDAGVRLPLIVNCPGKKPGVVNPNLVSFVDILPTLLDWSGNKPDDPKRLRHGRSFLSIVDEADQLDGWDHVFGSHTFHEITNYYPTRFMRDRMFKYHRNIAWQLDFPFAADIYGSLTWDAIRNSDDPTKIGPRGLKSYFRRPPEELYDLGNDPDEVQNRVDDPQYADVLSRMRQALEKWQQETSDPWLYRDGISVMLNKHHWDAGMVIPDRFDFDVDDPGTKNCKPLRKFDIAAGGDNEKDGK